MPTCGGPSTATYAWQRNEFAVVVPCSVVKDVLHFGKSRLLAHAFCAMWNSPATRQQIVTIRVGIPFHLGSCIALFKSDIIFSRKTEKRTPLPIIKNEILNSNPRNFLVFIAYKIISIISSKNLKTNCKVGFLEFFPKYGPLEAKYGLVWRFFPKHGPLEAKNSCHGGFFQEDH